MTNANAKRRATTHRLKTAPEPFSDVWSGAKLAEFRRNDRDFRAGDLLELLEYFEGASRARGSRGS